MEKKKSMGSILIKRFFILMLFCVFFYFFLGETLLPKDVPTNEYRCEAFPAEWYQVKEDGTRIPIEIPGRCEAKRNETVTIEAQIPEALLSGTYLCFRSSKQDTEMYVDGELRESYSTGDVRLFGKTSAVVYIFLKLEPEDAGKLLTICTKTDSSYSGIFHTVYYGDRMGIWAHFFKQYGGELVIAFITLVLGIVSILGSMILRLCYRRTIELEYLGWGVFLAAVWLIMNSIFRQLLFPNISAVNDMSFFMIMLLPLPFLIYMNELQKGRYQKWYYVIEGIVIADCVLCTVLYVTNVKDFADSIIYMTASCLVAILFLGVTMILDGIRGKMKEYSLVAIGILGASITACIQIMLYFQRTTLFNGAMMAVGLIFLLLLSVISTIRDILAMEKEKQQAISASESKARFLANMSHEIRTPINAVLGMDSMILRECKDMQIKEYALDIQNAGQTLLALINDILDMSKIESGKMEILPVEYDFSSMIHDIANMVSMKAKEKELKLNIYVDQTLPSRLFGDEIRIRQILLNILNNAVKYTEKGSIRLAVEGSIKQDKVVLEFSVKDTGIGIKEEDISKLFTAFERIEEKRNRHIEGTGLGMNITAKLLEMMGSSLKVESTYGKGSIFSFELEQQIVDYEPIGNLEERIRKQTVEYSYEASFTAPLAQILVVDDNAVNRKVFKNLLKETKVQIEEAGSGMECLDMVFAKHYDLIFLDHMMPEMDGVETLHHMKEKEDYPCKNTPVIALTANAVSGAKEMYLSEGFDEFLSKPVIPEKLEHMIQRLLPEDMVILGKNQLEENETMEAVNEAHNDCERESDEWEKISNIDGLDIRYALLHMPDKKLLKETIVDFYRTMDSEADYLKQCFDGIFQSKVSQKLQETVELTENVTVKEAMLNLYRIKVHAMKSSAALIGAVMVSGMAKALEDAAREQKLEIIESLTPAFLEGWFNLKEKLQPYAGDKVKKEVEDYTAIKAYLEMLRPAMSELDIDIADRIMEELMQYTYPERIQAAMEQLSVAVTELNKEKAKLLMEDLLKQIDEIA